MKSLNDLTNEELWQLFPIIISEYKDYWKDNYISESAILKEIIGEENIFRINHIGSTSIPGLLAKPTIDILIEVNDTTNTKSLIESICSVGYIYSLQSDRPAPHMMFMKGYTPAGFRGQLFHVHIRYRGDWDELYFRDYLLIHPEVVKEYGKLKLTLADKYKHDRDAYTNAKTDFILKINGLAREELRGRYEVI